MSKPTFKQRISQLDLRLRHRVPMVHQTESSECGLACLAMICGYYGKNVDLIALRRQFSLSTRGATLTGLTGIAEQLGLATRPLSLDIDELSALKLPVFCTGSSTISWCWSVSRGTARCCMIRRAGAGPSA